MTDQRMLGRLERDIDDLLERYQEGESSGPGLLTQLETVEGRTLASVEKSEGARAKPGSKPPMPLDALDLAQKIKRGAQDWAHTLGAEFVGDGYDSLRRLPDLCERADTDTMTMLVSDVGKWRSTARTVLGYQVPAVRFPDAVCPICRQQNIYSRPEQVRAWCRTEDCTDPDTGRMPEFTRLSLMVLIQEAG